MPFFFHHSPFWLKLAFPAYLWKVHTHGKTIFLTFDDGPIPEVTEFVLETLNKFQAKATFFCIGDNVRKHPTIFEKLGNDGHSVGNHTYNHLNGWKTKPAEYLQNFQKCQEALGHDTCLFRPPYGKITRHQARQLPKDTKIVMWDVLSGDYSPKISPTDCLKKTLRHTQAGSIIVFHDSLKARKNMTFTLPKLLDQLTGEGFLFKALPMQLVL